MYAKELHDQLCLFLCQYEGCLRLDSLEAKPEMEECSRRKKYFEGGREVEQGKGRSWAKV